MSGRLPLASTSFVTSRNTPSTCGRPRTTSRRPSQRSRPEVVELIHRDGWRVENYQFPLIADERKTGSTFLQRLLGLVDVRTDREVWMLYTSFTRTFGPGLL